jgi:hypothetical protein
VAFIGLRSDQGVELLDRVDDAEVEGVVALPDWVGGLVQAEGVVDPADEALRAGTAELGLELELLDLGTGSGGGLLDEVDAADLV